MSRIARISWPLALAAAMLSAAGVEQAAATTYKASIITFAGYDNARGAGISGTSIVGLGNPPSGGLDALLLNTTTNSVVSLNPGPDWTLQARAVSGDSQVGYGNGPTTGGNTHATLWHGAAASLVDLNPAGFDFTYAYGVSGNNQVGNGAGDATGGSTHALLWHGTANSVVDLHPSPASGFLTSYASDVYGDDIVGLGLNTSFQSRALLWHGTAASVINLHPAAYPQSNANGVSQDSQVGTGVFPSAVNSPRHALLWHGTAASVIDLHPAGFIQTDAIAVAGALQVGYGQGAATGGQQHALLWKGSAATVVDLHSLLVGLGPSFVTSNAFDVDDNGVILGTAVATVGEGNYVSYAIKWAPDLLGDFNENGTVNDADLALWKGGFGTPTNATHMQGDADGDGDVDGADLLAWQRDVGTMNATAVTTAIPEPSSLAICGIGLFSAAGPRRRKGLGARGVVRRISH